MLVVTVKKMQLTFEVKKDIKRASLTPFLSSTSLSAPFKTILFLETNIMFQGQFDPVFVYSFKASKNKTKQKNPKKHC